MARAGGARLLLVAPVVAVSPNSLKGQCSVCGGPCDQRSKNCLRHRQYRSRYVAPFRATQKLCECGCGEPAPLAKYYQRGYRPGDPMRFVRGHCGRVLTEWRQAALKARAKRAATLTIEDLAEQRRQISRRYRAKHHALSLARVRAAYWADPEKARAYRRDYHVRNRDRENAASLAWRRNHPDLARFIDARYRRQNPEKVRLKERRRQALYPEKIREKTRRRMMRKAGLPSVRYREVDIFQRDGWVCQLCLDPVQPELRFPHRFAPTIDHRLPISLGGHDVPDNVQLAHSIRNSKKGARTC